MKLSAGSILLSLCVAVLPATPAGGQVTCKCRPSPPGGVTQCQPGQSAVCNPQNGVCRGSCIDVDAQLKPLPYSAALLSKVLGVEVSVADLEKDPKGSKKLLEELFKISRRDRDGKLKYKGVEYILSVGLSEKAKSKLKAATSALNALMLKGKKGTRIQLPPIRVGRP